MYILRERCLFFKFNTLYVLPLIWGTSFTPFNSSMHGIFPAELFQTCIQVFCTMLLSPTSAVERATEM